MIELFYKEKAYDDSKSHNIIYMIIIIYVILYVHIYRVYIMIISY